MLVAFIRLGLYIAFLSDIVLTIMVLIEAFLVSEWNLLIVDDVIQ